MPNELSTKKSTKKRRKKQKKLLTSKERFGILETQLGNNKTKCSLKTKQNVNFELSGLNYNN